MTKKILIIIYSFVKINFLFLTPATLFLMLLVVFPLLIGYLNDNLLPKWIASIFFVFSLVWIVVLWRYLFVQFIKGEGNILYLFPLFVVMVSYKCVSDFGWKWWVGGSGMIILFGLTGLFGLLYKKHNKTVEKK